MKILKPKFWQKKFSIYSILLWPISILYLMLFYLRKQITHTSSFTMPIICVGNIYVGGTGKTPLSMLIANELKNKKKPVIIKKFYKEHKDEHELIKSNKIPLILNNTRKSAIEKAQKDNFDFVILDDGFQDFSIYKNINIICFNENQLIGNGMLLPSGPLREKISSLKRAQIIVINGNKNKEFEEKILYISNNLKIFYSKYIPSNISSFTNKKLLAFAGIGEPEFFFETLKKNNLDVKKTISFPDHYNYKEDEIREIYDYAKKNNYTVITTEKDFHRIKNYKIENIEFLKLKLEIQNKDKLIKYLLNN